MYMYMYLIPFKKPYLDLRWRHALSSSSSSSAPPPPPRNALRRTPRTFSRPSRFTLSNKADKNPPRAHPSSPSALSCTLHRACPQHISCTHGTSTHTSYVQHTVALHTSTIHLAPPPAPHTPAIASNKHSKPFLPHAVPTWHFWPTAHAHTARRARAAHNISTHHNPTLRTWPFHHLLAAPEPPPTHTNHIGPAAAHTSY